MSAQSTAASSAVNGIRTAIGIGGVLAIIVGILILVWPGKTAAVVVAIIAIYAIVAGLAYAGLGVFSKTKGGWARVGHIVLGVLFIIAGVVALLNLASATAWFAVFFGLFVGIGWIIEGIVSLSTLGDASSKIWTIIFAAISIIAGITLIVAPIWGAVVLWWLLGISLVILGVINLIRAFTFKGGI